MTTLANLKDKWGVAIKALVVRYSQLGVIEPDQARSLYKQISARRWNKNEPVPVGNESAQWLDRAMRRSPSPLERGADASGIGEAFFKRWTDWSPTPADMPTGRLMDFPEIGSSNERSRDEVASILRLPIR